MLTLYLVWFQAFCMRELIYLSQLFEISPICILIFQMRKRSQIKGEYIAQSHRTSIWLSQNLNSGNLASEPVSWIFICKWQVDGLRGHWRPLEGEGCEDWRSRWVLSAGNTQVPSRLRAPVGQTQYLGHISHSASRISLPLIDTRYLTHTCYI